MFLEVTCPWPVCITGCPAVPHFRGSIKHFGMAVTSGYWSHNFALAIECHAVWRGGI